MFKLVKKNGYYQFEIVEALVQPYIQELKEIYKDDLEKIEKAIENQQKRDNGKYHMTIFTPQESKNIKEEDLGVAGADKIFLMGLGKVEKDGEEAYYIAVESPQMQGLRTICDLPEKDFHITLGFTDKDIHDVEKKANLC